jgi:hypothetical protein
VSYQDLFARVRQETDSNPDLTARTGDYGQLCHAIFAVFTAADLHPVAQPRDLSDRFHNEVVGLISAPDLVTVARGFCGNWGWHFSPLQMLPYKIDELVRGEPPWGSYRLRDLPTLVEVPGWACEIARVLREQRIRRNTKRYWQFVHENAARVHHRLLGAAETAVGLWQMAVATATTETLRESAKLAEEYVGYYRQGGQIAQAFLTVTGLPDEWDVVAKSEALAQRIEQGQARLQAWADSLLAYAVGVTPAEVVEAAVLHHQDLCNLWEDHLRAETR